MGRGRAKAKQTKVARELKYSSPATDYKALERELSSNDAESDDPSSSEYDEYADKYADYGDEDDEESDSDSRSD